MNGRLLCDGRQRKGDLKQAKVMKVGGLQVDK